MPYAIYRYYLSRYAVMPPSLSFADISTLFSPWLFFFFIIILSIYARLRDIFAITLAAAMPPPRGAMLLFFATHAFISLLRWLSTHALAISIIFFDITFLSFSPRPDAADIMPRARRRHDIRGVVLRALAVYYTLPPAAIVVFAAYAAYAAMFAMILFVHFYADATLHT